MCQVMKNLRKFYFQKYWSAEIHQFIIGSFRIKSYINNGCVQMFSLRVPKIILCNLLKIVFVELLWGSAL